MVGIGPRAENVRAVGKMVPLEQAKSRSGGVEQHRNERFQIQVRGLHKRFGSQEVLKGVDLDIERHKINIIIGGSGQGKSVLLKHLIGLLKPDQGSIRVDGLDIVPLKDHELDVVRRKFGMLFQYAALFDSLTVEENVAFPLVEHTKKKNREIR